MLAGLTDMSSSMFPGIAKAIAPTPDDMESGYDKLQYDRTVKLAGYHTKVFDMHDPKDARDYGKLMQKLSTGLQVHNTRIVAHERRVMQRKDGSAGWFNYMEWMEFSLDKTPVSTTGSSK